MHGRTCSSDMPPDRPSLLPDDSRRIEVMLPAAQVLQLLPCCIHVHRLCEYHSIEIKNLITTDYQGIWPLRPDFSCLLVRERIGYLTRWNIFGLEGASDRFLIKMRHDNIKFHTCIAQQISPNFRAGRKENWIGHVDKSVENPVGTR